MKWGYVVLSTILVVNSVYSQVTNESIFYRDRGWLTVGLAFNDRRIGPNIGLNIGSEKFVHLSHISGETEMIGFNHNISSLGYGYSLKGRWGRIAVAGCFSYINGSIDVSKSGYNPKGIEEMGLSLLTGYNITPIKELGIGVQMLNSFNNVKFLTVITLTIDIEGYK